MPHRQHIRWRCRRGVRELDLMLTTYLERSYDLASSSEQRSFLELLELPDPDLQRILLNPTSADGEAVNLLVSKIRAHFSL